MNAYCNGHRVERHGRRGGRWWTVDEIDEHFATMREAACYARTLDHICPIDPAVRY
ncbi:MAG: hypothetical protein ACE5GB_01230 [Acidimicrobiales bacterium]